MWSFYFFASSSKRQKAIIHPDCLLRNPNPNIFFKIEVL
jgi:hypothetical protein